MKMVRGIAAAVVLTASMSSAAHAATVVFNGNTTGAATYNRPVQGNPPTLLSNSGSNVAFQSIVFNVDQGGSYELTLGSIFDNFLSLYRGTFDSASPFTNILEANDDSGAPAGTIGNARITRNLVTGTSYTAVATAFSNGNSGAFTLTATGPGTATLGNATPAVPEPATWAMMLLGFGLVGFGMRYGVRRSNARFDLKVKRIAAGLEA